MPADFASLHLMIVDDQGMVRTLIAQSLRMMGFVHDHIHSAADGASAIKQFELRRVDMLLCDVQMEPLNGLDLLKQVRCGLTALRPDVPFVFLSGHPERHTILSASRLHADGFIVKPPTPADIEKTITQALARPRPAIEPFGYLKVAVDTDEDRKDFPMAYPGWVGADSGSQPGDVVALDALEAGSVLAAPVRNPGGTLLLPAGWVLRPWQIKALQNGQDKYGVSAVRVGRGPVPGAAGDAA